MRTLAEATIGKFVVVGALHGIRVLDNASVVVNIDEECRHRGFPEKLKA
jgi:hypothetical protein